MTGTKTITDEATEIFDGASIVGDNLFLQNDSDTDMFLDIGPVGAALTTANGLRLEAGDTLPLPEPACNYKIRAIHGGTGNKTLRWVSF